MLTRCSPFHPSPQSTDQRARELFISSDNCRAQFDNFDTIGNGFLSGSGLEPLALTLDFRADASPLLMHLVLPRFFDFTQLLLVTLVFGLHP